MNNSEVQIVEGIDGYALLWDIDGYVLLCKPYHLQAIPPWDSNGYALLRKSYHLRDNGLAVNRVRAGLWAKLTNTLCGPPGYPAVRFTGMGPIERGENMRLGAPIFTEYRTPEEWARAVRDKGYRAAYCPVKADAALSEIRSYAEAAAKNDIVIAETGAWSNPLNPEPGEKKKALSHCCGQLRLADEIGARCCVNIAGSKDPNRWDGPHPDNFTAETFDEIVTTVRHIVDTVRPERTYYTLEPMPWIFPDTADSYLDLIRAVDRDRFAVHIDIVNTIRTPREHYRNADLIREWFAKLGPHIRSCHAKDTVMEPCFTSHTGEAAPGKGALDYGVLLREIERISPDMPLMIEHLTEEDEYDSAARYIRGAAAQEGIGL